MSVLDVINSLCIDVDADMRAQRAAQVRRARFALHVDAVLQLKRCPDWPEDRIVAYASSRAVWCAADVAEDGLAGKIVAGDAVWLLLQPGLLPLFVIEPFIFACAEAAAGYMAETVFGLVHTPAKPGTRTELDWRYAELSMRAFARHYSLSKQEAKARKLANCARIAGMVASLLRAEPPHANAAKYALRVSHLTMHLHPLGVQHDMQRQLQHLHVLVT